MNWSIEYFVQPYNFNMAQNEYAFVTRWRVKGTLDEATAILSDALSLPRWWPSVYLDVKELAHGDSNGVGRVVSLFTKGWLPYTLRWQFVVNETNLPYGFSLIARGDFVGNGVWCFTQEGEYVNITYDWRIIAEKGILKTFSFIMKPIFSANHHWAMRRGLESLKLELQRRRAHTDAERAVIAMPPAQTFAWIRSNGSASDEILPELKVFLVD